VCVLFVVGIREIIIDDDDEEAEFFLVFLSISCIMLHLNSADVSG